jgi:hypothetical protein
MLATGALLLAPSVGYASGDLVDLGNTYPIKKLIGPGSPNLTDAQWNVWGADLGSMFELGGRIYMTFGDTYGVPQPSDVAAATQLPPPDPNTQENDGLTTRLDHRSNTMGYFATANPASGPSFDGFITDRPGHAQELLPSKKVKGDEQTVIPTYGIAAGKRMYLHYMSVRTYNPAPQWTLNYSGLAYSDDGGQRWVKDPNVRWAGCCDPATTGLSNFGMVAMTRVGSNVYILGVPGGRWGGVKLARVRADQMLHISSYRYWTGSDFSAKTESAGAQIVAPAVGEFSVAWNSYYRKWIMLLTDGSSGNVMMRTASCLTGPWTDAELVIPPEAAVPYAPFLAPRWNDSPNIYFAVSLYGTYGVWWWHTQLLDQTPASGPAQCIARS